MDHGRECLSLRPLCEGLSQRTLVSATTRKEVHSFSSYKHWMLLTLHSLCSGPVNRQVMLIEGTQSSYVTST